MGCFSCVSPLRHNEKDYDEDMTPRSFASSVGNWRRKSSLGSIGSDKKGSPAISRDGDDDTKTNVARSFAFKELVTVTQNFREANLIGEGGFGSVYKGRLDSGLGQVDICKMPYMHWEAVKGGGIQETSYVCISSVNSFSLDQIVAVKQLNLEGLQGNQEFIVEVLMLSLLHHPNLVNLIGYCTHGEQRLLVYEFMPKGSLEIHLFDLEPEQKPLNWFTRLKIAVGAARGLEYLHCKANPPVIYRDLKSSNILLDNNFNVKLSDFGLAKLGPVGDKTHVSTRVMGTYGYCAPEYAMSGKLTIKSDIYSFGVVLLELITGRKAIDCTRKPGEQNLVVWSRPYLKDRKKYVQMVDPLLEGRFSVRSLHHAVAVTSMCLQEQASFRPHISDIVLALEYLSSEAESCLKSRSQRSSPSNI